MVYALSGHCGIDVANSANYAFRNGDASAMRFAGECPELD
jgi:hypothetical protein